MGARMAWQVYNGLGDSRHNKAKAGCTEQRREKHTNGVCYVMLCYVRELGDSHIGKVYSQGVTDGKREHNTYNDEL